MSGHVRKIKEPMIRPFDGSLVDAEGILAVERATFDESPYSVEQVRAMLTDGPQRAWVAIGDGQVVGVIIAFSTSRLCGPSWELDLLAILPSWRGRRLGTRLIRAAVAYGTRLADRARAVVATDNAASIRAFARVGFRQEPGICKLLIHRAEDRALQCEPTSAVVIREATTLAELAPWQEDLKDVELHPGLTLLLAEQGAKPAGYAELVEVQTILYRGMWIETVVAADHVTREALLCEIVEWVRSADLDEVGAMVPEEDWRLLRTLRTLGFRSLGDYYWLTAELPIPDLARTPRMSGTDEG